eukprot:2289737-Rhodomonas_salina.1
MGAETARVQVLRLEGRLCKGAETLRMQFCLCGSYADGMPSVWQQCRGDGIDAEGKADCVAAMLRGKQSVWLLCRGMQMESHLCGSNAEGISAGCGVVARGESHLVFEVQCGYWAQQLEHQQVQACLLDA